MKRQEKVSKQPLIVGAGMAGCIAAHMIPGARIIEAHSAPPDNHRAVLRFRDESVSQVTGIPFRKVKVHKGIYWDDAYHQPNPMLANLYSRKVLGGTYDRSIWNVKPVERYVAPTDFHMQMLRALKARINYGYELKREDLQNDASNDYRIISTMPMDRMAKLVGYQFKSEFKFRPTHTYNATVENCDAHFTVYFPGESYRTYRASVTGSRLIVECMGPLAPAEKFQVIDALGLARHDVTWFDQAYKSTYGKIAEIDDRERKAFILKLTMEWGVFSLGRFGTWRNLLLDDIVTDTQAIKGMIQNGSYETLLRSGNER